MTKLTLSQASFVLNAGEEYVQHCLNEKLLKSLEFEDIMEFKTEIIEKRNEILISLARLEDEE